MYAESMRFRKGRRKVSSALPLAKFLIVSCSLTLFLNLVLICEDFSMGPTAVPVDLSHIKFYCLKDAINLTRFLILKIRNNYFFLGQSFHFLFSYLFFVSAQKFNNLTYKSVTVSDWPSMQTEVSTSRNKEEWQIQEMVAERCKIPEKRRD